MEPAWVVVASLGAAFGVAWTPPVGSARSATVLGGEALRVSDPPLTKLQVFPAAPVFVLAISLLTDAPPPLKLNSVPIIVPVAPLTVS